MLGVFFVTLGIISLLLITIFLPEILGVSIIANVVKFLAPDLFGAYQDIAGTLTSLPLDLIKAFLEGFSGAF